MPNKQLQKKQIAWNIDGTRHDKHRFNENFIGMQKAKQITRAVLRIADDIVLQLRLTNAVQDNACPHNGLSITITTLSPLVEKENTNPGIIA
jgi:hypothetical protein